MRRRKASERGLRRGPLANQQTNTTNCRQHSTATQVCQPFRHWIPLKLFSLANRFKQLLIQTDATLDQHDNGVVSMRQLGLNQRVLDPLND